MTWAKDLQTNKDLGDGLHIVTGTKFCMSEYGEQKEWFKGE